MKTAALLFLGKTASKSVAQLFAMVAPWLEGDRSQTCSMRLRALGVLPAPADPTPPSGISPSSVAEVRCGAEFGPELCRTNSCSRRRVQHSVMCRPHHFVMINRVRVRATAPQAIGTTETLPGSPNAFSVVCSAAARRI